MHMLVMMTEVSSRGGVRGNKQIGDDARGLVFGKDAHTRDDPGEW